MSVGKLQLGQFVTERDKLEGCFVTEGSTAKSWEQNNYFSPERLKKGKRPKPIDEMM